MMTDVDASNPGRRARRLHRYPPQEIGGAILPRERGTVRENPRPERFRTRSGNDPTWKGIIMNHGNAAATLREALGCPIHNKVLHKDVGRGELDYEIYVRTQELLTLQPSADELVVPDELLFVVMHQTQELWLKCASFEAAGVVEHLDDDQVFPALAALDRVVQILQVLRDQIRVLQTLS